MNQRSDHGWRFARIAGIDIRAHASLLFLLAYVLFVASFQAPLVAQRAGTRLEDLSIGPVGIGLLFALGLFLSVTLHELAHALVSKALSVPVHSITLMMLGGITEMEQIPERRYVEFGIALVGPAISIALAVVLGWIGRTSGNPEARLFGYWLSQTNWALAIFNLLPAFPLDGGRALRSLLASRKGQLRGTQIAVSISKGMAWFFGALGLLQFNPLLLLIAFFIYTVAQSELFMLQGKILLQGLTAGAVGIRISPLSSELTLSQAAERMLQMRATVMPVSEPGMAGAATCGSLSLEMIRSISRESWSSLRVRDVMESVTSPAREDEPLGDAITRLAGSRSGALPLADSTGTIVGLVRLADILETLQLRALTPQPPETRRRGDKLSA